MKLFLLGLVCVLAIEARNVLETQSDSTGEDADDAAFLKHIEHSASQMRHKRRSRQSHYNYWNPYYYDNSRRDYDNRQDELLNQILRQLEEISEHIKRPTPPPPPPVYVPYPVPYPIPQYTPCRCKQNSPPRRVNTTFEDRWPVMDDENQNWGYDEESVPEIVDNGDDGSRPISLKPIAPNRPIKNQPPVDHGINQAGAETTTRAPIRHVGECPAAILSCCNLQQPESCFRRFGCLQTFKTGVACRPDVISKVLNEFAKTYGPVEQ